jgi:hypothetical protein
MNDPVFIGPYKAGSTSMGKALSVLGYKTQHWSDKIFNNTELNILMDMNTFSYGYYSSCAKNFLRLSDDNPIYKDVRETLSFVKAKALDCDCFYQFPIGHDAIDPVIKKILWPNGKFIFLKRPTLEWCKSVRKFFHNNDSDQLLTSKYNIFKSRYKIISKQYPKDVLFYELGSGWKPICDFLNKEIPKEDFPWLNKNV